MCRVNPWEGCEDMRGTTEAQNQGRLVWGLCLRRSMGDDHVPCLKQPSSNQHIVQYVAKDSVGEVVLSQEPSLSWLSLCLIYTFASLFDEHIVSAHYILMTVEYGVCGSVNN